MDRHEDPVGSTIETIKEAKAIAAAEGTRVDHSRLCAGVPILIRHRLEQQSQMLLDAGVILASSSTNTGLLAREFICKGEEA
ncbi:YahF/FdrA-like protein [Escherichia coli]|uniref:YahF/FdrA-like protein n=1 Tax=Escherichia coli TaxID=562 RepID=A0A2X1N2D5_ECOLX|nr:YahF/FdrA-like protein [Escherichia coli]